jgi:predicted nucleotidyltransferase
MKSEWDFSSRIEIRVYMNQLQNYTPFEPVNRLLSQLVQNVERILESNFVGCYLFGSLAVGDFDPATSDVDVLLVSSQQLNQSEIDQLSIFHKELFRSKAAFATELECFYVAKSDLQTLAVGKSPCYKVDRGSGGLQLETLDADWIINSFSLLNHGKIVAGPPVSMVVSPVSVEQLKAAIRNLMESWWYPMASHREKLEHPGYRFYAILTMARMLATFEFNKIVSKKEAASLASPQLDEGWKRLIEKAKDRDVSASIEDTQDFIRFTRNKLMS